MASAYRRILKNGKRDEFYTGKYKDEKGVWKTFRGYKDRAKTLNEARERELKSEKLESPVAAPKGIEEIKSEYLEWGSIKGGRSGRPWEPRNFELRKTYLREWISALGVQSLQDIKFRDIEAEEIKLRKRLSAKSVRNRVETLRAFLSWAVSHEYLDKNPLLRWKKPNTTPNAPHRSLTHEELARLYSVAPEERKLQYEVATLTGYRVAELRSIRPKDLIFTNTGPVLCVSEEFTKNRKPARQPITQELADRLALRAKQYPADMPFLGLAQRRNTDSSRFSSDCKKAGIALKTNEGIASWHSLRNVFNDLITASGSDLRTLKDLMRHSSAELSLSTYGSQDEKARRAVTEKMATSFNAIAHGAPVVRHQAQNPPALQPSGSTGWAILGSNQ